MKILVADDDENSRTLIGIHLSQAPTPTEVFKARHAEEAWKILEDIPGIEICLLDVMMPGMSGLDLLSRMRNDLRFQRLPAILCTARNDRETVLKGASLGISGYIVKPYRQGTVLAAVAKALSLNWTSSVIADKARDKGGIRERS